MAQARSQAEQDAALMEQAFITKWFDVKVIEFEDEEEE
jgi:hypothetical protein